MGGSVLRSHHEVEPAAQSRQYALERTRNHAQDKRVYRFEYLDRDWAKNPKMRQLIVRATNPQGSTVPVGILTDDRLRPAAEIIYLMFNRWTQESDFKYLDEHWGTNQITSYASVAYERLKDQVQQKQSKSLLSSKPSWASSCSPNISTHVSRLNGPNGSPC